MNAVVDDRPVENTYRLVPHDEKRFSPSAARKGCVDVVRANLEGKAWNTDEETVWTVQITEQVKQRVRGAWRRAGAARPRGRLARPAEASPRAQRQPPPGLSRARRAFRRSPAPHPPPPRTRRRRV